VKQPVRPHQLLPLPPLPPLPVWRIALRERSLPRIRIGRRVVAVY